MTTTATAPMAESNAVLRLGVAGAARAMTKSARHSRTRLAMHSGGIR
jgi:hypothetical protein